MNMYRAGYIVYDAWYKMKMQVPPFKEWRKKLFPTYMWCLFQSVMVFICYVMSQSLGQRDIHQVREDAHIHRRGSHHD